MFYSGWILVLCFNLFKWRKSEFMSALLKENIFFSYSFPLGCFPAKTMYLILLVVRFFTCLPKGDVKVLEELFFLTSEM